MSNGNEPHLIGNEELCGSTIDKISKLGPISGRGVETVPYGVNTRFSLKLMPIECYINRFIAIGNHYSCHSLCQRKINVLPIFITRRRRCSG